MLMEEITMVLMAMEETTMEEEMMMMLLEESTSSSVIIISSSMAIRTIVISSISIMSRFFGIVSFSFLFYELNGPFLFCFWCCEPYGMLNTTLLLYFGSGVMGLMAC